MDTRTVSEACRKVSRAKFGLDANETLQAVGVLQSQYAFSGLFYDAALEANPGLLDSISVDTVIGNSSHVLRQCKDPKVFFSTLDRYSIPYPEVSLAPLSNSMDSWLIKHAASTGGGGVSNNPEEFTLGLNIYSQKRINGLSFSLIFLASGEAIRSVGFNTLWSEALGKKVPYAYAGAINQVDLTEQQRDTASDYATTLTREFKLVGLNSIDYILSAGCIYVLEINPRIPASYELYESKYGSLIKQHIDACISAKLVAAQEKQLLRAHAIVYASERIQVPANFTWPLWTADRPHAEEQIDKYEPICSVFAGGKNVAQVREMIHTRKKTIIKKLLQANKN